MEHRVAAGCAERGCLPPSHPIEPDRASRPVLPPRPDLTRRARRSRSASRLSCAIRSKRTSSARPPGFISASCRSDFSCGKRYGGARGWTSREGATRGGNFQRARRSGSGEEPARCGPPGAGRGMSRRMVGDARPAMAESSGTAPRPGQGSRPGAHSHHPSGLARERSSSTPARFHVRLAVKVLPRPGSNDRVR